jgi:branched-chain amino acid transport system permease protein
MTTFAEFFASGLSFGAAYALLALSINIIYSSSNILNFAQGELMMVGGMLCWWLYTVAGLPYLGAVGGAMAGVAVLGVLEYYVVGVPLLRRRAALIAIIVATLGYSIVVRVGTESVFGGVARPAHPPLGERALNVAGAAIVPQTFLIVGVTGVLLLFLWWLYTRTTVGSALRALAFQRDGAVLVGVNTGRVMALTFLVSGALAGLAGVLVAPLSFASPFVGLTFAIDGFAAAIIGGLGSWPGAVIGGLAVGLCRALTAGYISPEWANLLTFGLILMMLYVRPTGIFAERTA